MRARCIRGFNTDVKMDYVSDMDVSPVVKKTSVVATD